MGNVIGNILSNAAALQWVLPAELRTEMRIVFQR